MAGVNAHRVKDRVHGHVGKALLFVERNAQFFECGQEFRVHVLDFFVTFLGLRGRVVDDVLQVHRCETQFAPVRLLHLQKLLVGFQAKIEHKLRFATERRRPADNTFIEALLEGLVLDIRDKTVFVIFAHLGPNIEKLQKFALFKRFFYCDDNLSKKKARLSMYIELIQSLR